MPANYDQPNYIEQRVRFFEGQYLKDQDFIDEQKYHLDRLRRHTRYLHVAGICEGLTVSTANNVIIVQPGTAIDSQGRQIVLAKESTLTLEASHKGQTLNLIIEYNEIPSTPAGTGGQGDRRWHENPKIALITASGPIGNAVKLAKLTVPSSGNITTEHVDSSDRQYSGLRLPAAAGKALSLSCKPDGSLAVLSGSLSVQGSATIKETLAISEGNPDKYQLTFGWRDNGNYRHAIRTRHNGNGRSGNAIDFYVWKYLSNTEKDAPATIGTLHNLTLDGGNVGIGTTAPTAALEISKGSTNDTALLLSSSGAGWGSGIQFKNSAAPGKTYGIYSGNDGKWHFTDQTGNVDRLVINSDGNVSITNTLSVTGSIDAAGVNLSGSLALTGSNSSIRVDSTAERQDLTLIPRGNGKVNITTALSVAEEVSAAQMTLTGKDRQMISLGAIEQGIGVQPDTTYFRSGQNFAWFRDGSHSDTALNPGQGGVVPMVINNDKVGIGTPTPLAALSINGGVHIGGDSDPGDNNLAVDGTLEVIGKSSLKGALEVTGVSTFNETLTVNSAVSLKGAASKTGLTVNNQGAVAINSKILHVYGFNFDADAVPLTLFDNTGNGGSEPNGTRDVLRLVREGVNGQSYGNMVAFAVGRYKAAGTGVDSCTKLDIKLTGGTFNLHKPVMTMKCSAASSEVEVHGKLIADPNYAINNRSDYYQYAQSNPPNKQWMFPGMSRGVDNSLCVTITTHGKPVLVTANLPLKAVGSYTAGTVTIFRDNPDGTSVNLAVNPHDLNSAGKYKDCFQVVSNVAPGQDVPVAIVFVDQPPAGTYKYKVALLTYVGTLQLSNTDEFTRMSQIAVVELN